jgi:hypothetical protein
MVSTDQRSPMGRSHIVSAAPRALRKSIGFVWGQRPDSPRNILADVRVELAQLMGELPKAVIPQAVIDHLYSRHSSEF